MGQKEVLPWQEHDKAALRLQLPTNPSTAEISMPELVQWVAGPVTLAAFTLTVTWLERLVAKAV
jgi:hypothetical protein